MELGSGTGCVNEGAGGLPTGDLAYSSPASPLGFGWYEVDRVRGGQRRAVFWSKGRATGSHSPPLSPGTHSWNTQEMLLARLPLG